MTNSYKVGPGQLILGSGSPIEFTQQITSAVVTPTEAVETTDAIPTLDGGEVAAEEEVTFTYVLSGNVVQDLAAGALIDWTWDHAGEVVPFVYSPKVSSARGVSGELTVVPLAIGGDVKVTAQSDFSFRIKGTPVFGVYDPVDDSVEEDV